MGKANRQVCDIDFRNLATKEPFLFFEEGNVTGLTFSSNTVFAKKKGTNAVGFDDPIESSISIECQVVPTKLYSLVSDGTIDTTANVATKKTIEATTAGEITLTETAVAGTVFIYAMDDFAGTAIKGTYDTTTKKFTATNTSDIAVNTNYEVAYIKVESTGVKSIKFNNSKGTKSYYVTMLTTEKDEQDNVTAKKIICYKVKPKRSLDLSYSSEGEPISVKIDCDCLEDADGNQIEMVEYDGE